MSDTRPVCAHCIYWRPDHLSSQPTSGHCHRFPPAVYASPSGTVIQKFPLTDRGQWCGEWNDDDKPLVDAATRSAHRHPREGGHHGLVR